MDQLLISWTIPEWLSGNLPSWLGAFFAFGALVIAYLVLRRPLAHIVIDPELTITYDPEAPEDTPSTAIVVIASIGSSAEDFLFKVNRCTLTSPSGVTHYFGAERVDKSRRYTTRYVLRFEQELRIVADGEPSEGMAQIDVNLVLFGGGKCQGHWEFDLDDLEAQKKLELTLIPPVRIRTKVWRFVSRRGPKS